MASRFQIKLQGSILEELERGPRSIAELADVLKANYHSTRNCVRTLQAAGYIKAANTLSQRNTKYELGLQAGTELATIPRIQGHKFHNLMEWFKQPMERSQGAAAVVNIAYHVTRIMDAARKSAKGENVELILNLTRERMEADREYIKQALRIYDIILNDPANWTVEFISRYPHDPDWNNDLLDAAMEHYFPKES
jgi:DNA-binding Lrp family transcriptional regulator